uniref:WLM domain-containing protein n=1 Tax=Strongyloides venezuelensis TaxID=75913 RepID=A0A0K0F5Y4_STRVS
MRTASSQSRKFLPSSLPAIYYDENIEHFEVCLIEALTDELFRTKNYWRPFISNNLLTTTLNGAKIEYELKRFQKSDDQDFVRKVKQEYASQISPQCYCLGECRNDSNSGTVEYEVKYLQSGHDKVSSLRTGLDIRSAIMHLAIHILEGPWVKNDHKVFEVNPRLINYTKQKTKSKTQRARDREVKCLTPQEVLTKRLQIYELCTHLSIAASFLYLEKNSGTCSREEYIVKGLLGKYDHTIPRPPTDLANPFSKRKQGDGISKKNDAVDEGTTGNGNDKNGTDVHKDSNIELSINETNDY